MKLYQLKIINKDKELEEELEDLALCYANSKEDAIKKFEELFIVEEEKQVEEVHFDSKDVAILNYSQQIAEWLKELKSLKEKDEARTVRYESDGYADGAMVVDYAFCPSCDHEIEVDSENWGCEFCPNCGQRLRWDE